MNKIKVVEIIESLSDGGAQSIVKDYACLIDKDKYEMVVFTIYPCKYSANYRQVADAGVKVVSVFENYNFFAKILNRLCKKSIITRSLRSFLSKYRPDAIHVHSVMLDYLNRSKDVINGCKLFYTCHSLPHRYFGNGHEVEFKAAQELIKSNGLRFIGLHEDMRQELNSMFHVNDSVVLKNGVNFSRFSQVNETKSEIRKTLNIPEDTFLLGHVGRFADMKNHTFLIDVFRDVLVKRPNAMLLLVGDGELLSMIKDKVSSNNLSAKVIFLSHRTDIPRLLKAMDVFVFPSIYEGLPVSIVESQIAGIRTITSDSLTHECFYRPFLIPLNLEKGCRFWADVILNEEIKSDYDRDINEFNMAEVVRKLEIMYNPK